MRYKKAADWNAKYPVGTPVSYTAYPHAEPFASKTRSEAWELGHGEPVVLIEGKTGGICLFALKPYIGEATSQEE